MTRGNSREPHIDSLVDALRDVRPSDTRRQRIAARLGAAGVIVTTSGVANGVSAAASAADAAATTQTLGNAAATAQTGSMAAGAAKLSVFAKLAAMPLAAKVASATLLLASAVTATLVRHPQDDVNTTSGLPVIHREASGVSPQELPLRETPAADDAALDDTPPPATRPRVPPVQRETGPQTRPADAKRGARRGRHVIRKPARPQSSAAARSPLAEEARLIEQALRALHLGQLARARALLYEHARRFPDGALLREREASLLILDQDQ